VRRITGCLPLAAALLVLAGCGDDSGGASAAGSSTPTAEVSEEPEPTEEPTEEPADDEQPSACGDGTPQVSVSDPGAEPRTLMELSPTVGDSVTLDMRVASTASISTDGGAPQSQAIPAMLMGFKATIDEVTDDQIAMSFVYDKAEFETDDPQFEGAMDAVIGLAGSITTTRSGVFVDGSIDTAGVDPMLAQSIAQLDAQLEQLTLPLPAEPVGGGAVWTTTTAVDVNGIVYCTATTYTLTEFDGDAYSLESEVTQEAEPTTLSDSTGTLEVIEGTGTGSGSSSGSLSFPITVNGTGTTSTHLEAALESGTEGGTLVTDISVELSISPRE
jgi:hypothetical protein